MRSFFKNSAWKKTGAAALAAGLIVTLSSPDALATVKKHSSKHSSHHKVHPKVASAAKPVVLTQRPGTELDKVARKLSADDIATSRRHHDEPLVLIGSAQISAKAGETGLFVQLQSASLCGSAGCSTDVYLNQNGDWLKVLDSVSGEIAILPTVHNGMHDIMVDGSDRWRWSGGTYQDTITAPSAGNLKKQIRSFQKKNHVKDPG
ncbi:hypothetical protein [Acetobacter sp. AN02]|uniref:hypothetical protein n=1 Tax=Acetobacter sp. AN02 TaxID=2894186 RepID=UPI0038D1DA2E